MSYMLQDIFLFCFGGGGRCLFVLVLFGLEPQLFGQIDAVLSRIPFPELQTNLHYNICLLWAVVSGTAYWFQSCTYRSQPSVLIWDFLVRSCSDEVFFLGTVIHAWYLQTGALQKFLCSFIITLLFMVNGKAQRTLKYKMTEGTVQGRKGPQRFSCHLCGGIHFIAGHVLLFFIPV